MFGNRVFIVAKMTADLITQLTQASGKCIVQKMAVSTPAINLNGGDLKAMIDAMDARIG